jgi:hypothetical protein
MLIGMSQALVAFYILLKKTTHALRKPVCLLKDASMSAPCITRARADNTRLYK